MTNPPDPTAYIEVLARLLCAADVHVHDGDHPSWQELRVAQHGRGQDDYRKAAAWLQPKLTVAAETRLSRAEKRCDELRAESKRRGKTVLEYHGKILALERQVDELHRQLGAEILRSSQAETAASVPSAPTQTADAAPVCKFEQGCHRVVACDPGCAVDAARMYAQLGAAPVTRAAVLREAAAVLDDDNHGGADELRRLADEEQYGDDAVMAASFRRDGFGEDEIAGMMRPAAVPAAVEEQPDTGTPHTCGNCDGVDPDTCFMNPDRPPEQCPAAEFEDYGQQCQKPAGHNLHTFEEQPADEAQQPETAPVHVGGRVNAEDCPACSGTNPPYPFICPGPDAAVAQPGKEN